MNVEYIAVRLSNALILFLSLTLPHKKNVVWADLIVVNMSNHTLVRCSDFPSSFSPRAPPMGLWGHHVFAIPADACEEILPPPTNDSWFVIIRHSHRCLNFERVIRAQEAGYKAAIIFKNVSEDIPDHDFPPINTKVKIPSTVVGLSCAEKLLHFQKDFRTQTVLFEEGPENVWLFLVIGISGVLFVILCTCCVAWLIHTCCGRRKKSIGLLSRWKLKKLKVHTYQTGDSFEVCAICLEDYQTGEKLRILPCAHAFHCKCVDVWLTENRKTCPLCNKAADSRWRQTRRINEEEAERTPLLSGDLSPDDSSFDSGLAQEIAVAHEAGLHGIGRQPVVEVHREPRTRRDQPKNYGSVSTHVADEMDSSTSTNTRDISYGAMSSDGSSPAAEFCIGTPTVIDRSSAQRTSSAEKSDDDAACA